MYQYGNPLIKLSTKDYNGDIEVDSAISKIVPEKNEIIMKNGTKHNYRNLVYSGYPFAWKDQQYFHKFLDHEIKKE